MGGTSDQDGGGRGARALVYLLFLVSGAGGLALEVLWMGALGRVFGGTAEAAAATLAAFFVGLGIGAAVFGRIAPRLRRPLLAYGMLEIGVALTAGLGLLAGDIHGRLYGAVVGSVGTASNALLAAQLGLALLLIGPGAFLMGGTFPVLGEHVVRTHGGLGRRASLLYALNTLGAALGAFLATFVLRPLLGARTSWLAAAAVALAVGVTACLLGTRDRSPSPPTPGRTSGTVRRRLGALAFASGLLALALQVLWNRMFARAYPNSIYVFGAVLVVFLAALSLGAVLARMLMRRSWRPDSVLAVLLGLSGLAVAATVPFAHALTNGLRPPPPGLAWGAYVTGVVLDAALVLGVPVVILGTVLPWLFRMAETNGGSPGRTLGRLQALNTLGAVLGSLLAGFVLLRGLGLWDSIRVAALAYAVLGLGIALRARRGGVLVVTGLTLVLVGVSFVSSPPAVRLDAGEMLVIHREGPAGSVAVIERHGERKLVFDNVYTLGGTHDERWEGMQAHVPLLIHPEPRRVFLLGLGTGITAGAVLTHPVEQLHAAELVPDVIEASRDGFGRWANGLFSDPRAVVSAADARHVLRWTNASYDVIVGDLFFPWEPGTAYLYTREHFAAVRDRLMPGGLFAQWLPCYQLSMDELLGIARTMTEVFPLVTLWRGDFFADRPLLALVGHREATRLDVDRLRARARLLVVDDEDLARDADALPLHLYAGNLTRAARLLDDARLLTDDDPWIAWTAPRSERLHQSDPSALAVGDTLLAFETAVLEASSPETDPYLAAASARDRRFVEAGLTLRRMAIRSHALDRRGYLRHLHEYVRQVPAAVRPNVERWVE